jgi:hypothetical protein
MLYLITTTISRHHNFKRIYSHESRENTKEICGVVSCTESFFPSGSRTCNTHVKQIQDILPTPFCFAHYFTQTYISNFKRSNLQNRKKYKVNVNCPHPGGHFCFPISTKYSLWHVFILINILI